MTNGAGFFTESPTCQSTINMETGNTEGKAKNIVTTPVFLS